MNRSILVAIAFWGGVALSSEAGEAGWVLKRDGWSFDDSRLDWRGAVDVEQLKSEGVLRNVAGWTEYKFSVPADGWYELWLRGIPNGWTRTVSIDGKTLLWHSIGTPEDEDKSFKGLKEANFWLSKGDHRIRFHRTTWPGDLPDSWELRAAQGDPAGSLRVEPVENIVRVGEKVPISVLGGDTGTPLSYDLFLQAADSGKTYPAGKLDFPATAKPVIQKTDLQFPAEGVYYLKARSGEKELRPADLKAGAFVAIDTANPPAPAADLVTTPVVEIDCTATPPAEGFWEKDGATRVVEKPFGRYRESSGLGRDGDGYWGLDGFSYRVKLPEVDVLYRIRVEYPDDDRRSMAFWINDGSEPKGTASANVNTGGVETGDQYPLTNAIQTHEAFFYPQAKDEVIVAVLNLVPSMKAAASRIIIERVDSGLPAAPLGETRGRAMGFYFEESGRWRKFFGAGKSGGIEEDIKTLNRWAQWNRYLGANLMFPTINVYQANHYPSRLLDGYFSRPFNEVRLASLVAEKYGGEFVPEFHLTGQDWFDKEVMGVWSEQTKKDGKDILQVHFASPEAEEMILRDRDGNFKHSWEPFMYNALHPRVQELYINLLGELADSLADSKAFGGISSRMMFSWQWQGWNALPNMSWGYDDWTIAYFEKDTGIKVPGKLGDALRFRERYNFLTGPQREKWIAWRCEKVFDYHRRMLARIQKAKPEARLFFNWFGLDRRHALSADMLDQMREVGMDWRKYANEQDIVIIPPGGTYGRRYSLPITDAEKLDSVHDRGIQEAGRFGGRAYGIYSDYYEVNRNLDWAKLGGKPYSAFDSNLPSGLNERGMYAQAVAECDTGFFSNGGSGWIFGTPSVIQPFLREYRALPAVPFEAWEKAKDPVAVWSHRDKEGTLWFYLVNRLPISVEVSLELEKGKVFPAPGGDQIELADSVMKLSLEPFMMRSFRATEKAQLADIQVTVPEAYIASLKPMLDFVRTLRPEVESRRVAPELSDADAQAALEAFDGALSAFDRGEYYKARALLERLAAVRIYYLSGQYPPALWARSISHGVKPLPSALIPQNVAAVFPEAKASMPSITDLSFDKDGHLWMSSGRKIRILGTEGNSERSLQLFAPYEAVVEDLRKPTLGPVYPLSVTALRPTSSGRVLVQQGAGAPLLYDAMTGRNLALANKVFSIPGQPVWLLAVTKNDEAILSCSAAGVAGIYLYNADGTLKRKLSDQEARSAALDAAGNIYLATPAGIVILNTEGQKKGAIDGTDLTALAVQPDGQRLFALNQKTNRIQAFARGEGGAFGKLWEQPLPQKVTTLTLSPSGEIVVGFKSPDKGVLVRSYMPTADGLTPGKDLVAYSDEKQSIDSPTPLKVYDGKLYYQAFGKLMRLTPGESDVVEMAFDPQFRPDQPGFEAFAFAPNGDLFLASNWNGKKRGINIFRSKKTGTGWDKPEPLNGGEPLWEGGNMVATDLAFDMAGRLILRLQQPNARGGNISLYRWSPETGQKELLIDLGGSVGVGEYGLQSTADGGLLVAGGSTRKIVKFDADGKVIWLNERVKSSPPGYQDHRLPVGIASDSSGNVWVTDPSRHSLVLLDKSGQLQGSIGGFGTSLAPLSLNAPSGIAAIKDARGVEWIYVADSGNQRLIKFSPTR